MFFNDSGKAGANVNLFFTINKELEEKSRSGNA